ncbi:EP300-interacting inhibitor of differentiation 2B [Grammomys surdaster]|uniref:EP300-interacting inhibitor of differentiation 2B n=1 Tax=Grammomys surdaster TaxID=491861 RepID=UPI00109F5380|nr:EP300-interacting inhibitor of differentiation 2B [Grammomys surdaster]
MSELPGDSRIPGLSPMNGVGDVLQAGMGGGSQIPEGQESPLARAARSMAQAPGLAPGQFPGVAGLMAIPHVHAPLLLLELYEQRMFQHYLHTNPLIPTRVLQDIEERRRLFVEGCRAREAAFDADPPQMDSDGRDFMLALIASDARGPPPTEGWPSPIIPPSGGRSPEDQEFEVILR